MFDLQSQLSNLSSLPHLSNLPSPEECSEKLLLSQTQAFSEQLSAVQNGWAGLAKYNNEFMIPYLLSVNYFNRVEGKRLLNASPLETFRAYLELAEFNMNIFTRSFLASTRAVHDYLSEEGPNALTAWVNSLFGLEGEGMWDYVARQAMMVDMVTNVYPQAIQDIEPEYGFHFERGIHPKVAETDRFILYQIMPSDPEVEVREDGKPILIVPPYVLGANILAFLPGEKKSYTHCFANQGIPTYIRIMKNIHETPALQTMTGEDDTRDTRFFCERIVSRHGKPVTLNGYCQGGFMALCNMLTGELDGLVDAMLTCVSPMDGTRSTGLKDRFLDALPQRFNDLAYGTKTLPNGNQVADGLLMGWVYKLKSIENESPLVAFFRDMLMLKPKKNQAELDQKSPQSLLCDMLERKTLLEQAKISKTAAALNYWLQNERTDLPMAITDMSFISYNQPIAEDGTLPVKLFGQPLNLKRLQEKGIPWLICYGERDDLVEKETALAPRDFIDVEIAPFPKGHVAIATSWSNPKTEYALHTRFGKNKEYRGPVRFHLDLDELLSEAGAGA